MRRSWLGAGTAFLMAGCTSGEMVLERAHLKADLPTPPPTMVSDSTPAGSLVGQIAASYNDVELDDPRRQWSVPEAGAQAQLQFVATRHLRFVGGAGWSDGASLWFGPVISAHNAWLHWDFELMTGATWVESEIAGHGSYREDGSTYRLPSDTATRNGPNWWGLFGVRVRGVGSGPWLEARMIPQVRWGRLDADMPKDIDPLQVSTRIRSFGGGWVQELPDGLEVVAGVRGVSLDESAPGAQLVLSIQKRLYRGAGEWKER